MGMLESPQPVGMGSKTILFNSMTKLNRKKRPKFKSYFTYKMVLKLPKVNMGSKSAPRNPSNPACIQYYSTVELLVKSTRFWKKLSEGSTTKYQVRIYVLLVQYHNLYIYFLSRTGEFFFQMFRLILKTELPQYETLLRTCYAAPHSFEATSTTLLWEKENLVTSQDTQPFVTHSNH